MAGSINSGYTNLRQIILTGGGGGGGHMSGSKELTKNTYVARIFNGEQPNGYDLRFSFSGFAHNTGNVGRKVKGIEVFFDDLKTNPQNPRNDIEIKDVVLWLNFYSLQLNPNFPSSEWSSPHYLKLKDHFFIDDARIFGGIKASLQYADFRQADGNSRFLPNNAVIGQVIMTYYFEV